MQAQLTPENLVARINDYIAAGRTGPAKALLSALRRLAPGAPFVSEVAARLAIVQGDLQAAQMELDAALSSYPDDPALRKCRADVRHRRGDLIGAVQDAAEAVIAAPNEPTGKAILGILMMELGRTHDAVACLREALAANPAAAAIREALACALVAHDDPDAGAAILAEGITLTPDMLGCATVPFCWRASAGGSKRRCGWRKKHAGADTPMPASLASRLAHYPVWIAWRKPGRLTPRRSSSVQPRAWITMPRFSGSSPGQARSPRRPHEHHAGTTAARRST
jgi:predicted Zn-dependent protease